jgi:hypothetical protein
MGCVSTLLPPVRGTCVCVCGGAAGSSRGWGDSGVPACACGNLLSWQIFLVTCSKSSDIRAHLATLQWPVVECTEDTPRRGQRAPASASDDREVRRARSLVCTCSV